MTELGLDLADYQAKGPTQALDAALATVRSYCGWQIAPVSTAESVSVWSPGGRALFLPTRKLTSIASITQNGVVLLASSYTFESYGVVKVVSGYFSTLTKLTVVFTHGYTELPDDAKDVVLTLADRSLTGTRGLASKSVGPFSENYGLPLGQAEKDKLDPYRIATGFA